MEDELFIDGYRSVMEDELFIDDYRSVMENELFIDNHRTVMADHQSDIQFAENQFVQRLYTSSLF